MTLTRVKYLEGTSNAKYQNGHLSPPFPGENFPWPAMVYAGNYLKFDIFKNCPSILKLRVPIWINRMLGNTDWLWYQVRSRSFVRLINVKQSFLWLCFGWMTVSLSLPTPTSPSGCSLTLGYEMNFNHTWSFNYDF